MQNDEKFYVAEWAKTRIGLMLFMFELQDYFQERKPSYEFRSYSLNPIRKHESLIRKIALSSDQTVQINAQEKAQLEDFFGLSHHCELLPFGDSGLKVTFFFHGDPGYCSIWNEEYHIWTPWQAKGKINEIEFSYYEIFQGEADDPYQTIEYMVKCWYRFINQSMLIDTVRFAIFGEDFYLSIQNK